MKAIMLLSTGIDSPVAAYLMKEKGVEIILLHGSRDGKKNKVVERIRKKLGNPKIEYFNHYKRLQHITSVCNPRYTCVLCKRDIYRIAEKTAKKHDALMIITGENIGQVATQTLKNLKTLDNATTLPIIRPLIGLNKNEIINIAKKIGTYELSEKAAKCAFLPRKPLTITAMKKVIDEESRLSHTSKQ